MTLDRYTIYAQMIPAFLVSAPILLFLNYHMPDVSILENFGSAALATFKLSPGVLFIYPIMRTSRFVGKTLEEWFFGDELHFPTTELLLRKDATMSVAAKDAITQQLASAGYSLATASEEETDEPDARKRIVEAMSFIRRKVGKGIHAHDYNIGYGFWRNLVGGAVLALILCIAELASLFFDQNLLPFDQVIGLTIFYVMLLIFSKSLIKRSARRYAKVLLGEFRSSFVR